MIDDDSELRLYYPEKPVEPWEKPEPEPVQKVPFNGVSTYTSHFPPKEADKPAPIGNPNRHEPAPMIDKTTISQCVLSLVSRCLRLPVHSS